MARTTEQKKTVLEERRQDLWRVFAKYPRGVSGKWATCVEREMKAQLKGIRTEELPEAVAEDAFRNYTLQLAHLKHFLPRILELRFGEKEIGKDPWEVWLRLEEYKFSEWPVEEREAVTAFLLARWDLTLSDPPFGFDSVEYVSYVGRILRTVQPLLDRWQANPSRYTAWLVADWVFLSLYQWNELHLEDTDLAVNYMGRKQFQRLHHAFKDELDGWLRSPATWRWVDEIVQQNPHDDDWAAEAALVYPTREKIRMTIDLARDAVKRGL